ncbi:MAG: methyltransferase [Legionellaceae bacterium]|nr:methyltransferase [Legionellaceae bacterium]MBP9774527.1 methyltransferase [Legionellaceae bacterium]
MASFNEHLKFLGQFLKLGRRIATPCVSPRALAIAACKCVDAHTVQTIVELGAGTGAITKVIIETMHPQSTLVCIEINAELGSYLKKYSKNAHIVICDVTQTEEVFCDLKLDKVDVVISSLPFRNLPPQSTAAIIRFFCKFSRSNNARFCQITIIPWMYKKVYQLIFKNVESQLVWKSIPPGEVYICSEVQEDFETHLPSG